VPLTAGYQIKDIASRSGFSAATLRYYEDIGLLPESTRTPAGYRLYDDRTIERLAFIARAKQVGCTLDEIADLSLAWDGGQCGPVQDRLRSLVAAKLAGAQQQIVELMTLTAELQRAAATLELHRPDGPCDDQCGCVGDTGLDQPHAPQVVSLVTKPASSGDPPIASALFGAPA
jgi:MerR family copper efflux transcriptional regulator